MTRSRAASLLCAFALALGACACKKPAPRAAEPVPEPVSAVDWTKASRSPRTLEGVYDATGGDGWRWAAPKFAVLLDPPEKAARPAFLELDFLPPQELMGEGAVTLRVSVNGVPLASKQYSKSERRQETWEVPAAALAKAPARIEFETDRSFRAPNGDARGLIVLRAELKVLEDTQAFKDDALRRAREAYRKILESRQEQMPPGKQHGLIRLFHDTPVWKSTWFHGERIVKNPLDLWVVEQLIHEIRPRYIVETGTLRGGSALFFAQALYGLALTDSRVLTVDIGNYCQAAEAHPLWRFVRFFHGSSTDPRIVAEIAELTRGHSTLVTLDSDHSMKHVLNELRMYAPLVSPGSYIIVEDTHMDGAGGDQPGPLAAVDQFLREDAGKDFERDLRLESFIMSWNTGGWLRRKKSP